MASITDPFTGEEAFNAAPEKVYAILSSMDCYAKAIPGLVSHELQPDGAMKVAIKPGLSFVSGTVKAMMKLIESTPPAQGVPARTVMTIDSSGIGMTLNLEAAMNIVLDGANTKVQWTGRVTNFTGLVKLAPAALVRGAADKVIKDGWIGLRRQIEG
ncbi:MAG: SRPBCC domain-containing protein [Phycisphaerales bacterium]|nr:SRPBCC domain-containing protein [Phycisphaerales bacterium]